MQQRHRDKLRYTTIHLYPDYLSQLPVNNDDTLPPKEFNNVEFMLRNKIGISLPGQALSRPDEHLHRSGYPNQINVDFFAARSH
jgi:hypothetical protein